MAIWGKPRDKADGGGGTARSARLRTLIWATLVALLCGMFGVGQPIEDVLRVVRNKARLHPASGQIVVAAIDERSLDALGTWPWPRSRHAQLVDRLNNLGARSISFDVDFSPPPAAHENAALSAALARSTVPVTLAVRNYHETASNIRVSSLPAPELRRHATLSSINIRYDYAGRVWRMPYGYVVAGARYPSMAARIAGVLTTPRNDFLIDYSIDPRTVPTFSIADILAARGPTGRIKAGALRGKDVVIAGTSPKLLDIFLPPGYGPTPGGYIQILGAETLRSGIPRDGGWGLLFFAAFALACGALRRTRLRGSLWMLGAGITTVLVTQLILDGALITLDTIPALLLLLSVAGGISWSSLRRSYRTRGTVNMQSGLLNLDALRLNSGSDGSILIAARINNYAQIAAALSAHEENALVAQIAQRLTIGSSGQALYQGDEGIFAWFTPATNIEVVGEHLDALHGFFRESLTVADKQVDLAICFGIDTESTRSSSNRLGSALVACDEAAAEGIKWKVFDPAALVDASWKLSLLGQLDRAIDSGDFWVAYQPKLDIKSGRIVGAEALARWTHPIKGAISPVDFILAAEQSDRIERLTRFVLNHAIGAAAAINNAGYPFNIAVNLSTRLIGDPGLPILVRDLLDSHGLAARHLTLEVTETAAMGTGGTNLETLVALRDLGVCISIDDYGTGLSTLEYLKKIPATEIKIDQSFVTAVTRSHSDRLMVHSTIQLVHSLGHVVVAEGVETPATLDALKSMGCDYAQGFLIGRPVTLDVIANNLGTSQVAKRANG